MPVESLLVRRRRTGRAAACQAAGRRGMPAPRRPWRRESARSPRTGRARAASPDAARDAARAETAAPAASPWSRRRRESLAMQLRVLDRAAVRARDRRLHRLARRHRTRGRPARSCSRPARRPGAWWDDRRWRPRRRGCPPCPRCTCAACWWRRTSARPRPCRRGGPPWEPPCASSSARRPAAGVT